MKWCGTNNDTERKQRCKQQQQTCYSSWKRNVNISTLFLLWIRMDGFVVSCFHVNINWTWMWWQNLFFFFFSGVIWASDLPPAPIWFFVPLKPFPWSCRASCQRAATRGLCSPGCHPAGRLQGREWDVGGSNGPLPPGSFMLPNAVCSYLRLITSDVLFRLSACEQAAAELFRTGRDDKGDSKLWTASPSPRHTDTSGRPRLISQQKAAKLQVCSWESGRKDAVFRQTDSKTWSGIPVKPSGLGAESVNDSQIKLFLYSNEQGSAPSSWCNLNVNNKWVEHKYFLFDRAIIHIWRRNQWISDV